jgi:hypothetical protein
VQTYPFALFYIYYFGFSLALALRLIARFEAEQVAKIIAKT